MIRHLALAILMLLAGSALTGCDARATPTPTVKLSATTPAEPTPTQGATPDASIAPPRDIAETLAWMQERTMRCAERAGLPGGRRWECTGLTAWDSTTFDLVTITIERDGAGKTTVIGVLDATQTMGKELCPACDPYTGFFSDTVALAPITGPDGVALGQWIDANAHAAWRKEIGSLVAVFRPAMPLMTILITIEPAG